MYLTTKKETKNKIVTITLTTEQFTDKENQMLDQLGEPIISINKSYGANGINFSKKIRTGFKVKVRFDINLDKDTDKTAEYIESFLTDVKDQLSQKMYELEDSYNEELKPSCKTDKIDY